VPNDPVPTLHFVARYYSTEKVCGLRFTLRPSHKLDYRASDTRMMNQKGCGRKHLVLAADLKWRLPEGAEEYHENLSAEPAYLLRFEPSIS
jgi:hypothetical protein